MAAMLRYRLIFGPIMIAALVGLVLLDEQLDRLDVQATFLRALFPDRSHLPSGLILFALFLTLIALGSRELAAIFRAKQIPAQNGMCMVAGMIGCALAYVIPGTMSSQTAVALFATVIVAVFLFALVKYSYRQQRVEGAVAFGAATLFALVYMGLLPGFYLVIRSDHSAWIIAAILLTTKSCDIGAYFTGRALGRHKLIVWLSPGKTWEGLIGGVLFSALVATGLAALLNHLGIAGHYESGVTGVLGDGSRTFVATPYPLTAAAVAGLLLGLFGQFGDLTASLFKRDAGIKDSGSSIPGFGGLLDVVDSPLVVAPLAYWLLSLAR